MKSLIIKNLLGFFSFLLLSLNSHTCFAQADVFTIESKVLGEKRKIRIQIPAGNDQYTAFPVLYVLDGESQMNHVGGQIQYLSESYKIIPNMIVVGIDNTDRMRDLTPTGGENFFQFISKEVMPFVEGRYHTSSFRILYGHSLGALMSVYCLMQHPDYFDAYIAVSPSFQWDNNSFLKQIAQKGIIQNKKKFLFFSDANEDVTFHQNQLTFDSLLKTSGSKIEFKRMFYPEETHLSEPIKAFYDGIRFVYPNWHLAYNSSAFKKTMNASIIKDHYAELSKIYGYEVIAPHDELILISRFLRNDSTRMKDAIDLLQYNAIHYPGSAINFETLGDTYLKAGDKMNARISYEKALAIEPSRVEIKEKIGRIFEGN